MTRETPIRNIILYAASLITGFATITFVLASYDEALERRNFEDIRNATGIVSEYNPETQRVNLIVLNELHFSEIPTSTSNVELITTDNSRFEDQSFVIENNVIVGITEKSTFNPNELHKGDYVYVTYTSTPRGFLVTSLLRGQPMPTIGIFTPQLQELQAQLRL